MADQGGLLRYAHFPERTVQVAARGILADTHLLDKVIHCSAIDECNHQPGLLWGESERLDKQLRFIEMAHFHGRHVDGDVMSIFYPVSKWKLLERH